MVAGVKNMIELLFVFIESENANNCSFWWQFEKHYIDHLFVSLLDNNFLLKPDDLLIIKETTMATAAATSLNKRINENDGCARAL